MQAQRFVTWLARYRNYLDCDPLEDFTVAHVTTDSREISTNTVFIATKGYQSDGTEYVLDAIAKGAVAVLMDTKDKAVLRAQLATSNTDMPASVYGLAQMHELLPNILADFYQQVSQLELVGITGTNGKTTVSQLIAQLATGLSLKAGVIGTLGAGCMADDGQLVDVQATANTTPSLAHNFRLLNQFAEQGCRLVSMEVSSAGLDQSRVNGLQFDSVIMTNLSQDHLDYHSDMQSYANAKRQLFENNPDAAMIMNIDDAIARQWFDQYSGE